MYDEVKVNCTFQAVRTVKLSNNRISEAGVRALARMLHLNQAIVALDMDDNLCERGFSCVNHRSTHYPESEAMQELQQVLKRNQVTCELCSCCYCGLQEQGPSRLIR